SPARTPGPAPGGKVVRPLTHWLAVLLLGLLLTLSALPSTAAAAPIRNPQSAFRNTADPPDITAPAAIAVEYPSGRVLFTKNMHRRMAEASTTKIMTALLVLQRVPLSDTVTIVADDLVGESTMGLVEGEQQTVENLLY